MTRLIRSVRDLSATVPGAVALLFAATVCVLAIISAVAACRGNLNGAKEIASTMALLIGVVGALLASPERHGRATDPSERGGT